MSDEAAHRARMQLRAREGQLRLSKHATKQMGLRGRTLADVTHTLLTGEVIRTYPEEKPYPEFLFLGYPQGSDDPCYVVVASNDETVNITVHNLDPEIYEPDHRTRRPS